MSSPTLTTLGTGTTETNSAVDKKEIERAARSGIRTIISDALTELDKLKHFSEDEIDELWKKISSKI